MNQQDFYGSRENIYLRKARMKYGEKSHRLWDWWING